MRKWLQEENGSAITEFLILTLPLFVPLLIFLSDFANLSGREIHYQSIARQAIRAFVMSANSNEGISDVNFILHQAGLSEKVEVDISCPFEPCFTPHALAKIRLIRKVNLTSDGGFTHYSNTKNTGTQNPQERIVLAVAYERFDEWISQGQS